MENNNDSNRTEENNFRKEITGDGKYNTGTLNIEGLYQYIDSQEQEQQLQKDNINIEI